MSLTMIATCWNQRSLLRESTGAGRPSGARNSRQLEVLIAELQTGGAHAKSEDAVQVLVGLAVHFTLTDLPERQHAWYKSRRQRSRSETVTPTDSTPVPPGCDPTP